MRGFVDDLASSNGQGVFILVYELELAHWTVDVDSETHLDIFRVYLIILHCCHSSGVNSSKYGGNEVGP